MNVTTANVRLADGDLERLRHLLETDPKLRSAAARILNRESEKVRVIAKEITEKEIHRRPQERRTKISLAHGAELHDSFEVVPAREVGPNQMKVSIRNTHPAFAAVNNGTPPHRIEPRVAKTLAFPFRGPVGKGQVGKLGTFAVRTGDAPMFYPQGVDHPGAQGHQILQRALRTYRRRQGRVINGRYG